MANNDGIKYIDENGEEAFCLAHDWHWQVKEKVWACCECGYVEDRWVDHVDEKIVN